MAYSKVSRALISVSDKTGLIEFAKILYKNNVDILSTGGTLKALKDAGIPALAVEDYTGFPEMMDGRVKTLHPKIHGGLLFLRNNPSHVKQAKEHDIKPIDLVVVNLYPFEAATAKGDLKLAEAKEFIDIGGPSMLRSAAKNYEAVTVITDVADYAQVAREIEKNGGVNDETRLSLSQKVFERTSEYDAVISQYMKAKSKLVKKDIALPAKIFLQYKKAQALRYGENPTQKAAYYVPFADSANVPWTQLHGKELSFNNLMDVEATLDVLAEFCLPAACVIKHNNPCGIAQDKDAVRALTNAIDGDILSAFGGIVGVNRPCDAEIAQKVLKKLAFFEVLVAPSFKKNALKLLTARKNLRLIEVKKFSAQNAYDIKFLRSGALVQEKDAPIKEHFKTLKKNLKVVTKKKLSAKDIDNLIFAFQCSKVVKSNAIVLTRGSRTVGIGAGQMSRVDSVQIAIQKAGKLARGAMLGSDAFFPMPDSIEFAAKHKIKAIIQPGGSIRDKDVIAACDKAGIAMAFTGERHFRH